MVKISIDFILGLAFGAMLGAICVVLAIAYIYKRIKG